MPLKDMAYTETEQAAMAADRCCPMPADYQGPKYPWGLELRIENGSLEKLGLDISKFKVGQEVPIDMVGRVTGLSINERENGERQACLTIVAAKMDIATKKNEKEQADTLYGAK